MGASQKVTYLLTVLTGPNAGAQQHVTEDRIVIGSHGDVDTYLDDFNGPNIEISFSDGKMRIVTEASGIKTRNGDICEPGKPLYLDAPTTLILTPAIQVNISADVVPAGFMSRKLVLGLMAGAGIFAGVLVSQFYNMITQTVQPQMRGNEAFAAAIDEQEKPTQNSGGFSTFSLSGGEEQTAVSDEPELDIDDALDMLRTRIRESGLPQVFATGDSGVIRVNGFITAAQRSEWLKIRDDYDSQFAHIAPLLINIEEREEVAPIAIAAVWLGFGREILTRNGLTLSEGDSTPEGWMIEEIGSTYVSLVKDDQNVVVEF